MAEAPSTHITIIGAGLGGALLACYLAREGFRVDVYERRPDPRVHGFLGGRSINLALSARGLHALAQVGLADEVLKAAVPMPGRMIHLADMKPGDVPHFQPYSKDPTDRINSVSRADLNILLINAAAKHSNVRFFFDYRCAHIDFKRPRITFERSGGEAPVTIETDRIIGADGAFSAVRLQMMLNMDRMEYRQEYLQHGYKELMIPPAERCGVDPKKFDGFAMEPRALHIWPRGGYMMIALPNQDRSFTCTCFWPFTGPNGFDSLRTEDQVRAYFQRHFPDAVPLMPTLEEDFLRNPTSSLVTIHCLPWRLGDKAVLIGDAAHAIVPFYGQGANAAFEDCVALTDSIREHVCGAQGNWGRAFEAYEERRRVHTDAIAEMALHNFIEMRDLTASRVFHAKKRLEHTLHRWFPGWFMPLYNMISFTTIPYAAARARARRQWQTLGWIAGVGGGVLVLLAALAAARWL